LTALLALAAVIIGAVSAIDDDLSQLPPEIELRKVPQIRALARMKPEPRVK
jgi:hypothetical protein